MFKIYDYFKLTEFQQAEQLAKVGVKIRRDCWEKHFAISSDKIILKTNNLKIEVEELTEWNLIDYRDYTVIDNYNLSEEDLNAKDWRGF
jgi:hypothetical protein